MTAVAELPVALKQFARHETFHPRFGWLRRAYEAAKAADGAVFHSREATTVLGVGKNMVGAIRYWGLAYKVIEEVAHPENSRLTNVRPTPFGTRLFEEWDPYLEEPGSLWLLHWKLLKAPSRAPAWWAIFNSPRSVDFNAEGIREELLRFCEQQGWEDIADSSLEKDARCILRMFGSVTERRDFAEDSIDSPFADLDLLREVPGPRGNFVLNKGDKSSLPDEILAGACLDYLRKLGLDQRTHSLGGLARGEGSPGRVFALTESAIADALGRFSERSPWVALSDVAGARQLLILDDPQVALADIITSFYSKRRGSR